MYVEPNHRGTSVSGQLDEYLVHYLRDRCGMARARLTVTVANTRARRFYERTGWTKTVTELPAEGSFPPQITLERRFELSRAECAAPALCLEAST